MSDLDLDAPATLVRRPRVARLLAVLGSGGGEARVVGGAVRNALLGRHVHEIDVATTTVPDETSRLARAAGFGTVPTGIAHGTVTVLIGREPFEVTTLREDVETDGRHAVVRFGRDFSADAARRDFTMNALSVDAGGRIHDTVGGLADLAAGRVRFIGDPATRIREDYLRVLRFFRFQADFGQGEPDPDAVAACLAGRDGLALLSRERVRTELLKLLAARQAVETARLLSETGLLARLTGGIGEFGRLARTAEGEQAGPEPVGRLASWLVRVSEDADRLRDTLRLSKTEHARLRAHAAALAALLTAPPPLDRTTLRRLASVHGLPVLVPALAALEGEPRPRLDAAATDLLARYRAGAEAAPVFPLTGAELLRRGLPPGPGIGRRLAEEKASWLAAGCPEEWGEAGVRG